MPICNITLNAAVEGGRARSLMRRRTFAAALAWSRVESVSALRNLRVCFESLIT